MPVAQASLSATQQIYLLPVFGDLAKELAGIGIKDGSADGHLYHAVLPVAAMASSGSSALPVGGEDVPLVTQGQEGPHMAVSTQDHVAATAAVTTVGTSLGNIFRPVEMPATGPTLA